MTRPDNIHNFPTYTPGRWDEKTGDQKIADTLDALGKAWNEIRLLEDRNQELGRINNQHWELLLDAWGEVAQLQDRNRYLARSCIRMAEAKYRIVKERGYPLLFVGRPWAVFRHRTDGDMAHLGNFRTWAQAAEAVTDDRDLAAEVC